MRGRFFNICLALLLIPCLFPLAGCATARVDWNALVGAYTYDQAVLELGPPERVATLTDGTRVAEWLTSRGRGHAMLHPIGPPSPFYYYGAPRMYHYTETTGPDYYVRLTFSPDGILTDWQRVTR